MHREKVLGMSHERFVFLSRTQKEFFLENFSWILIF
jgi:hypothetical protein